MFEAALITTKYVMEFKYAQLLRFLSKVTRSNKLHNRKENLVVKGNSFSGLNDVCSDV